MLGEIGMVISHAHYTQVQGQLLIYERQFTDFFVWTLKGAVIERGY